MKKIRLITFWSYVFTFSFFLSSNVYSQNFTPTLEISLNITADEISQSRLHSLIAREFRTLNDVEIVSPSNAHFKISVVAVEVITNNDQRVGYVASLLITEFIRSENIYNTYARLQINERPITKERMNEIKKEFSETVAGKIIDSYLKRTVTIEHSSILVDPDIENLAKRIVAETDYKFFERIRKEYQQIIDGN